MTKREYYSDSIERFLTTSSVEILGKLTARSDFDLGQSQRDAWVEEISFLQTVLTGRNGSVYFEYAIPRMGRRIDVVLIIGPVIFVIEFKVGEKDFTASGKEQVWDYSLDLKNFHESSHHPFIAPILIPTKATTATPIIAATPHHDKLLFPIECTVELLGNVIDGVLRFCEGTEIDRAQWEAGRYCPTPTIIEAAMALYNGHSVADISRTDASAINLSQTSDAISEIIHSSKENSHKSICFLTGVPGAGKTLVGLNIATKHIDRDNDLYSVFLSGNGPLVAILREALARDKVQHEKEQGRKLRKGEALSDVKMFIQNVHHFRDDCLVDTTKPPIEHVALFDEAQRLKPHAIDVKSPMDPIHWFLDGKEDVRSSYYLEDVATEFHVQGLELDWACVTWDADFRYDKNGWKHRSFCGDRWNLIKKHDRQNYLKNAYRVLLTRARQGMVIVVPEGDSNDATRNPEFYDPTYKYLADIGFTVI